MPYGYNWITGRLGQHFFFSPRQWGRGGDAFPYPSVSKLVPFRARRRMPQLTADIETSETPDASYMSGLIAFYGAAIPHLIAGQYAKRR